MHAPGPALFSPLPALSTADAGAFFAVAGACHPRRRHFLPATVPLSAGVERLPARVYPARAAPDAGVVSFTHDKEKDMSQNLADTHFDATQWQAVDAAMDTLEQAFAPMLAPLDPNTRRRLVRMGDASEAFCRKSRDAMDKNRGLLPRSLDVDEMGRDLDTHDALNARLARLAQLIEKVQDTEIALGSDAMVAALEGYAFLKIAGKGEGLDGLRRELGKRFTSPAARKAEPATA
jgi:hypothetical protein